MLWENQKLRKEECPSFIINHNYLDRMLILQLQPPMDTYSIETFHKNMLIGYINKKKLEITRSD